MMKSLENWANNYRKYIQFQIECLKHCYKYGGTKFHHMEFPTFSEFEALIGDERYDYTKPFAAHEYNRNGNVSVSHNCLQYPFRPDLNWCKVTYSQFKGVKWNKKFEFVIDKIDLYQNDRLKFIKNFK